VISAILIDRSMFSVHVGIARDCTGKTSTAGIRTSLRPSWLTGPLSVAQMIVLRGQELIESQAFSRRLGALLYLNSGWLSSNMQYCLGFIWGFVLLFAFAGWGLGVRRILKISPAGDSPDWGQAVVLGMSLIIAIGGMLNCLHVMTAGVIWLLTIVGLALFVLESRHFIARSGWNHALGWPMTRFGMLVAVLCLAAYSSWVVLPYSPLDDAAHRYRWTLNPWDDLMGGYVTYPFRLLSEGSLGDDPFNDRSSISALGGLSVLQSFALLFLPATFIHLIDPGMAILATPLVLHGLGKRQGWPSWLASALTIFSLALRHGQANASATTLPPLFLLSLCGLLEEVAIDGTVRKNALLAIALVAAAAMTLKQVLIPGTGLILVLFLMIDLIVRRDWARSLVSGVVAASATVFLLAPWLISMNRAAGTPIYPMLGKGYRANPMVDLPALAPFADIGLKMRDLFKDVIDPRTLIYVLLGALGIMAVSFGKLPVGRRITYLAVLLGSTPALLLLAIVFSNDEFIRYGYPYMLLVFLTSFALILGVAEGREWLAGFIPGGPWWVGGGLIMLAAGGWLYKGLSAVTSTRATYDALIGNAWNPDADRALYKELQASIPPGKRFFAFLPMAHLLDFKRNPVNVMDSNCAVSPPPGMPLRGAPEDVAAYFRSLGITRIAGRGTCWTPGGESQDPERLRGWSETFKGSRSWDYSVVYSHYLMFKALKSLSASYETLHFASDLMVIDLDRPSEASASPTGTLIDRREEWKLLPTGPAGLGGSFTSKSETGWPDLGAYAIFRPIRAGKRPLH
jgi:hypothetical protein